MCFSSRSTGTCQAAPPRIPPVLASARAIFKDYSAGTELAAVAVKLTRDPLAGIASISTKCYLCHGPNQMDRGCFARRKWPKNDYPKPRKIKPDLLTVRGVRSFVAKFPASSPAKCGFGAAHNRGVRVFNGFCVFSEYCQQKDVPDLEK